MKHCRLIPYRCRCRPVPCRHRASRCMPDLLIPDVEADPAITGRRPVRAASAVVLVGPAAARGKSHRHDQSVAHTRPAVRRQADRAAPDLRRPGGDCHREHATVQRDPGKALGASTTATAEILKVIAVRPMTCSRSSRRSPSARTGCRRHVDDRAALSMITINCRLHANNSRTADAALRASDSATAVRRSLRRGSPQRRRIYDRRRHEDRTADVSEELEMVAAAMATAHAVVPLLREGSRSASSARPASEAGSIRRSIMSSCSRPSPTRR